MKPNNWTKYVRSDYHQKPYEPVYDKYLEEAKKYWPIYNKPQYNPWKHEVKV